MQQLHESDDWDDLAEVLTDGSVPPERTRDLVRELAVQIGVRDIRPLAQPLEARARAGSAHPCVRMLHAELAFRIWPGDIATFSKVGEPQDEPPDIVLWWRALRAEHALWRGDPVVIGLIHEPIDVGGGEGTVDALSRLAAARLRRVRGLVSLLSENLRWSGTADRFLQTAITDFRGLGREDEALLTRALALIAITMLRLGAPDEVLSHLHSIASRVDDLGSDHRVLAWLALGAAAGNCHQPSLVSECIERARESLHGEVPQLLSAIDLLATASRVRVNPGEAAMADLSAVADELDHNFAPIWFVLPLVETILDRGQPAVAAKLWQRVDWGLALVVPEMTGRIQAVAARLADGLDDPRRPSGAPAQAAAWAGSAGVPEVPDEPVSSRTEIRALAPDLVVRRRGEEVKLGDRTSKMLALLVTARRPVTTDWMITSLWPEADRPSGRNRLNMLVYRLRERLGLEPGELIERDARGIALDVTGVQVDVWEFQDLAHGSEADRAAAFVRYRSDLCARQLAYDEEISVARDALREIWLEIGVELVERDEITERDLRRKMSDIGVLDDEADLLLPAQMTG